jgi:hypothetical protein
MSDGILDVAPTIIGGAVALKLIDKTFPDKGGKGMKKRRSHPCKTCSHRYKCKHLQACTKLHYHVHKRKLKKVM